jgi:hypothetical protein
VQKLLVLIGATAGSALGWWIGDHVGVMSAFFVSLLGTAAGAYLTKRGLDEYA